MSKRVFLVDKDSVSRAVNGLSQSTDREFRSIAKRLDAIEKQEIPFFDGTYTASTAGVAFTTSASWTTMLSLTTSPSEGVGDSFQVKAVACLACPNATATVALRLLGAATTLFEESLIEGTTYMSHTLIGNHKAAGGEVPVFKLQIKRTAGTGDVNRTALGIYTQRGYT